MNTEIAFECDINDDMYVSELPVSVSGVSVTDVLGDVDLSDHVSTVLPISVTNVVGDVYVSKILTVVPIDVNVCDVRNDVNVSDVRNVVNVSDVWNNVNVSDVRNDVNVSDVHNDVNVSDVWNNVNVSDVRNDVNVSDVRNDVNVSDVRNDVNVADVRNDVNVSDVRNDVNVADVRNDVNVADVQVKKLSVGERFASFEEVKLRMKDVEELHQVNFHISRCCTVNSKEGIKRCRRYPNRLSSNLKYHSVTYSCIHGGRKFRPRSTGARTNHKTFKKDCPVRFTFMSSKDGQSLVLKKIIDGHSHEVSKIGFSHLPWQRALDKDEKMEAVGLLSLKADKQLIREHLQNKTGKCILLRDLSNIRCQSKKPVDNQLTAAVRLLENRPGSVAKLIVNPDSNELVGIYYQDETMQKAFSDFPELLMVDATYKLNNLRMPLFVMIIVDGNGETQIVCTFLAADERGSTLRSMMDLFKATNPDYDKIRCIMTDKDMVERTVLREELPDAALVICLYHVLRTFRREVTCEKMSLRGTEKDLCLGLLQEIVYSRNAQEYDENVARLRATGISSVIQYFEKNWSKIREEFVESLKAARGALCNATNNRVESINQKIKTVCQKYELF